MRISLTRQWRRTTYVCATVLLALGSGHVMQSSSVSASSQSDSVVSVAATHHLPDLIPTCEQTAAAEPGIAGMYRIVLSAPCAPETIVSIGQGDLIADWRLDDTGQRHISFTPLGVDLPLVVTWGDGTRKEIDVNVDVEARPYRVALAWTGPRFFSLTANEFGASASATDVLLPERSGFLPSHAASEGGFLTVLGDGFGRTAEVYTLPSQSARRGVVRLSVHAPITLRTCGREAQAVAFQTDALGGLFKSDVTISLPECDAIGQTLVLRNLFRDLRLAAR